MEQTQLAPHYVVMHDGVGVFSKGQVIPNGTYDDEQLARLVGLGAIAPFDPPGTEFEDGEPLPSDVEDALRGVRPTSPSSLVPKSAEEFKERLDAAAIGAATGGPAPSVQTVLQTGETDYLAGVQGLNERQRQALRDAGFDNEERIAAASDEDLMALDGVGEGTVRTLRGR